MEQISDHSILRLTRPARLHFFSVPQSPENKNFKSYLGLGGMLLVPPVPAGCLFLFLMGEVQNRLTCCVLELLFIFFKPQAQSPHVMVTLGPPLCTAPPPTCLSWQPCCCVPAAPSPKPHILTLDVSYHPAGFADQALDQAEDQYPGVAGRHGHEDSRRRIYEDGD